MGRQQAIRDAFENPDFWYERKSVFLQEALDKYGLKVFSPKKNSIGLIRIIPPKSADEFYAYKLFVHNINKTTILCPQWMKHAHPDLQIDNSCPICEKYSELKDLKVEWEEGLSNFSTDIRWLLFILNMEKPETIQEGPFVYSAPKTLLKAIKQASQNPRNTTEYLDVSDAKSGKVVIFRRDDSSSVTNYSVSQLEDCDELPEEFMAVPDFPEVLRFLDYDEIMGVMGSQKTKEQEQVEAPISKNKFKFSKPPVKDVAEEEGADVEEEEEEEEVEVADELETIPEPPVEEEDDDEEEEKPAKPVKKTSADIVKNAKVFFANQKKKGKK